MSNQSIDPAQISWMHNAQKRGNDALLLQKTGVFGGREHIRTLTLPAADWCFEQVMVGMSTSTKFECIGIERDPDVHSRMKENADKIRSINSEFKAYSKPCGTYDFLCEEEEQFDFIYLDYMGTWSKSKKEDMQVIFERKLANKFLAFTISLHRGRPETLDELEDYRSDEYLSILRKDNVKAGIGDCGQLKIEGIPSYITYLAGSYGVQANLKYSRVYDTISETNGQTTAEMLLLFTIK